jgi:hypothetical protein
MMYPLVRELAADGVPVAVTCRVLNIARQPYYRWLRCPVTDRELDQAHLANAIFDAHRDDPEFGYRFLADEARNSGHQACDRTVWRHCADNGWWSVFGKKRSGKKARPGTPAHDDLVKRVFTAEHVFQSGGRYRVQIRLKRNRKVLASTSTTVTVRPGVRDSPYGAAQP